jgi:uncharacterized membrane protein YiaA
MLWPADLESSPLGYFVIVVVCCVFPLQVLMGSLSSQNGPSAVFPAKKSIGIVVTAIIAVITASVTIVIA